MEINKQGNLKYISDNFPSKICDSQLRLGLNKE